MYLNKEWPWKMYEFKKKQNEEVLYWIWRWTLVPVQMSFTTKKKKKSLPNKALPPPHRRSHKYGETTTLTSLAHSNKWDKNFAIEAWKSMARSSDLVGGSRTTHPSGKQYREAVLWWPMGPWSQTTVWILTLATAEHELGKATYLIRLCRAWNKSKNIKH